MSEKKPNSAQGPKAASAPKGNGRPSPPKRKLPHIDKLIEKICVVDRTRGIIAR